jgi:hypothetical protein
MEDGKMKRKIKLVFTVVVTMCIVSTVIAGEEKTKDMKVECGDIIKSEFTKSMAAHEYQLNMKPEDAFKIQIAAIGDHFYPRVDVYEPGKNAILSSNRFGHHRKAQTEYESGVLSGRGDYTIKVRNYYHNPGSGAAQPGVLGSYYLKIGCNVDGLKINPGSDSGGNLKSQLLKKISELENDLKLIKALIENSSFSQ